MDIWRKNAITATVEIDDKSILKQSLMQEDRIEINITSESSIQLEINDYVVYGGVNYYLLKKPAVNKRKENEFVYSFVFSGRMHLLERVIFTLNGETSFYLTGELTTFMTQVRDEGRRIYGATFDRQIFDSSTLTKTIHFDNVNLLQALQTICQEFEKEFEFRDSGQSLIIDIRNQVSSPSTLSLRFKEGLRSINVKELNTENLITSLYVFGSDRNIEASYGQKRLRLPFPGTNPRSVVEKNVLEYGLIEGVIFFNDIYPRRTGTITTVSNNGTTWKFRDSSMNFDLNSQLITESAKITFNSGPLSGQEFEIVSYNNTLKEFEIAAFTDDQDLTLPNTSIQPTTGNEYVLHNIKMPSSYITTAENELAVKAQTYINRVSKPNLEISCEVDPVYLRKNTITIVIGQESLFNETDLGIDNELQRVVHLTKSLANENIYSLKFAASQLKGRIKRLDNQINSNKTAISLETKSRLQNKFFNRTP